MLIDDKVLKKLEILSAIEIDEDKKEAVKQELSDILNFVENLNELEVPADINIQSDATPIREDQPIKSNIANQVLKNAPKSSDGFFIVPKIVE